MLHASRPKYQRLPVSFVILTKPVSWNVLARKNHWTVTSMFQQLAQATLAGARLLRPIDPAHFPVEVVYRAEWMHKRRHDIDSLIVKPLQDELVRLHVFPDDSTPYVGRVSFEGQTGCGKDRYVVTISPSRSAR